MPAPAATAPAAPTPAAGKPPATEAELAALAAASATALAMHPDLAKASLAGVTVVLTIQKMGEVREAASHAALAGAHRVLRPGGGVLVSITWAPPLFRRGHYLDDPRYDWGGPEVVVEGGSVGGAVPVVVYTLRRGDREAGAQWRRPPPGQVCRGGGDGEGEGLPAAPAHEGMDDEDYLLRVGLGGDESD